MQSALLHNAMPLLSQILRNFDKCWQILTNFHKFWQILTTFDKFWQILTNVDKFWQSLTKFDKFWQICWQIIFRIRKKLQQIWCRAVPVICINWCILDKSWKDFVHLRFGGRLERERAFDFSQSWVPLVLCHPSFLVRVVGFYCKCVTQVSWCGDGRICCHKNVSSGHKMPRAT